MFSRLTVTAILAVGLSASAHAQYNRINRFPVRPDGVLIPQGEVQGTIQGVTRAGIVMLDANNQAVQVHVPQDATVQVTATATADYLQNGLIVEFKADLDGHGAAKGKVSDLRIGTAEETSGLFAPESAPDDVAVEAVKPAKRKPASKTAKAGTVTPGTYRVVGKITSSRAGKLMVRAGRNTVTIELSDTPTISLESSDLSLAAQGDKISAKGVKKVTREGTELLANEVKIELIEPLSGPKKKTPGVKSAAKRPSKKAKKDDALPPANQK